MLQKTTEYAMKSFYYEFYFCFDILFHKPNDLSRNKISIAKFPVYVAYFSPASEEVAVDSEGCANSFLECLEYH